jgi:hypothetical protein
MDKEKIRFEIKLLGPVNFILLFIAGAILYNVWIVIKPIIIPIINKF